MKKKALVAIAVIFSILAAFAICGCSNADEAIIKEIDENGYQQTFNKRPVDTWSEVYSSDEVTNKIRGDLCREIGSEDHSALIEMLEAFEDEGFFNQDLADSVATYTSALPLNKKIALMRNLADCERATWTNSALGISISRADFDSIGIVPITTKKGNSGYYDDKSNRDFKIFDEGYPSTSELTHNGTLWKRQVEYHGDFAIETTRSSAIEYITELRGSYYANVGEEREDRTHTSVHCRGCEFHITLPSDDEELYYLEDEKLGSCLVRFSSPNFQATLISTSGESTTFSECELLSTTKIDDGSNYSTSHSNTLRYDSGSGSSSNSSSGSYSSSNSSGSLGSGSYSSSGSKTGTCENCGKKDAALTQGFCNRCWASYQNWLQEEEDKKANAGNVCANCGKKNVALTQGFCDRCWASYQNWLKNN